MHALGRPGGPCDLGVDFTDDADAQVAAVWPFFGQFVAHDITADRSPLTHRADADRIRNFRVPRADLEGLYGSGPVGSPYLYAKDDPAKLLLSAQGDDVPRNHEGIALIGDPRNDVHLFTSQMAVAFIKLHNRLVDRLREDETAEDALFEQARSSRHLALPKGHVMCVSSCPATAQLATELGRPRRSASARATPFDRDAAYPLRWLPADAAVGQRVGRAADGPGRSSARPVAPQHGRPDAGRSRPGHVAGIPPRGAKRIDCPPARQTLVDALHADLGSEHGHRLTRGALPGQARGPAARRRPRGWPSGQRPVTQERSRSPRATAALWQAAARSGSSSSRRTATAPRRRSSGGWPRGRRAPHDRRPAARRTPPPSPRPARSADLSSRPPRVDRHAGRSRHSRAVGHPDWGLDAALFPDASRARRAAKG